MIIHAYNGFDLDKFLEANQHLRVTRKKIGAQGLDFFHVHESGSTQDVEQTADEVSVEDRLSKLEKDFYQHSHMNDDGMNPCAGEIILKWPKELKNMHPTPGDEVTEDDRKRMIEAVHAAGDRMAIAESREVARLRVELEAMNNLYIQSREARATHRCKVCDAKWIKLPGGNWTLASNTWGKCCDTNPMRDQIEAIGLTAELEAEEKRGGMHADLNRRTHLALGGTEAGDGSSWHDMPERANKMCAELGLLRHARDGYYAVLSALGDSEPECAGFDHGASEVIRLLADLEAARVEGGNSHDMYAQECREHAATKGALEQWKQELSGNQVELARLTAELADAKAQLASCRDELGTARRGGRDAQARVAELERENANLKDSASALKCHLSNAGPTGLEDLRFEAAVETAKELEAEQVKSSKSEKDDHASEMHIRDLIVAAHTLTLMDGSQTFPPVTVRVEDLQALLRLLDRARLNTKVKKL